MSSDALFPGTDQEPKGKKKEKLLLKYENGQINV